MPSPRTSCGSSVVSGSRRGDAVGLLSGDPHEDYYQVSDHLVHRLFAEAFVEYVSLAPAVPVVPYVHSFDACAAFVQWRMFISRWSESDPAPNHQHLVAAAHLRDGPPGSINAVRAEAIADNGRSYTVIYVDEMEGVFGSTANSRTLAAEVAAHEVAHLWNTNPRPTSSGSEHCSEHQWDAPGKVCQAVTSYECTQGGGGGPVTCAEFLDDEASFHYKKNRDGVDSEYLWIRRACEPVPNENVPMPDRWWSQPPPTCP